MTIPTFPSDHTLAYLAEGAANVVYRIVPPPPSPGTLSASDSLSESCGPSTPPPSDLPPLTTEPLYENKLLRLRKALPNLTSVFAAQVSFEKQIAPLLPSECVVEQTRVKLARGLISARNAELRRMESQGTRSPKRHGAYLADDEYGSLVTDMSSAGNPNALALEFKPKWLAQSPSAPKNARRCRTCALQSKRLNLKGKDVNAQRALHPHASSSFCPLRLTTSRSQDHVAVAGQITRGGKDRPEACAQEANAKLIGWVRETPLIRKLRNLQIELDEKGVLLLPAEKRRTEAENEKLAVAMTLRDCTLFLKACVPL